MNNNTTVDKILEATARQLMKKSLSGLRLRAIAEEAGVVNSNLHYYYKTKDELLEALLEDMQAATVEQCKHLDYAGRSKSHE